MRNVAAEVFCSTATYKCTKMEKRLDSLLKKITTNEDWGCLAEHELKSLLLNH